MQDSCLQSSTWDRAGCIQALKQGSFCGMLDSEIIQRTALISSTYYPSESESDALRSELSLEGARKARKLGYPLYVVDGGSSEDLLLKLRACGANVLTQDGAGMGRARRKAIGHALDSDAEVLLYLELEKIDLVSSIASAVRPIFDGRFDVVIPKRISLDSYPLAQQYAEQLGNSFFAEVTGIHADFWFGPRAWQRDISSYFLEYDGYYGDQWDALFVPILRALKTGKRIGSVEVDYQHPSQQTELESGSLEFTKKRIFQLSRLTEVIENEWNSGA